MKSPCASVTGATGFIGTPTVRALRASGWHVRAIVRPGNRKPVPEGAEIREANLLNEADLRSALAGSDVVIHTAGLVRAAGPAALTAVNVDGTRTVVAAANAVAGRLVHISSLAAAGPGTPSKPVSEEDAPRPVNDYGRSKLAGEAVVRDVAAVPWVILRPSAVYGPGDRGFFPLVRLARRGVFLLAAPRTTAFTFAYVGDVVDAIVSAAASALRSDVLFIGHPTPATTEVFLKDVATALGRSYRPLPLPAGLARVGAVAGDWIWRAGGKPLLDSSRLAEFLAPGFVCDVSRARARLGFSAATSLEDGLARTIAWYRQQGWI